MLNFARELEPEWIVIENVVHMKRWHGFLPLVAGLNDLGYGTTIQTLDASDFGVPQTRRRLFILCSKGAAPEPVPLPGIAAADAWEILDYDPVTGKDLFKSRELFDGRRRSR